MDFIYPLTLNAPTSNPHDPSMFAVSSWFGNDPTEWRQPRDVVLDYIKNSLLRGGSTLPVGTKLYHGSLDSFLELSPSRMTFFGIDVVISLWYMLELQRGHKLKNGTLYEFVTTKPIPAIILEKIANHASSKSDCKKQACIHPQVAYHGFSVNADPPYDLSIEVTLPMDVFKDYIQLKRTYTVDVNKLLANRGKSFREYNPTEAIIETEMVSLRGSGLHKSRKNNLRRLRKTKKH